MHRLIAGRAGAISLPMPIHMIKTAAGLHEIDQLIARQAGNRMKLAGQSVTFAYTRYSPKRADEIIASGGSIYWILRNRIQVRQKILAFELVQDPSGNWCKIVVEPQLYQTLAAPHRAIQGWRYLLERDAPKDRGLYRSGTEEDDMPEALSGELRRLGLL